METDKLSRLHELLDQMNFHLKAAEEAANELFQYCKDSTIFFPTGNGKLTISYQGILELAKRAAESHLKRSIDET